MFSELKNLRKTLLLNGYKNEFENNVNEINLLRGKLTAITFIFLETLMLFVSITVKGKPLFTYPNIFYVIMYLLMIVVMSIFLVIFYKLGKDIPNKNISILTSGIAFIVFILMWCAGISIIDQISYGQIIVYVIALIAVGATPLYRPLYLLLIYIFVQALFIVSLFYLSSSHSNIFGNITNSSTMLVISWVISLMRYKNKLEDFNYKKLIQQKNQELELLNRKLEKLSQTDSLTGIFNRAMFDSSIKAEWERCKRHFIPISLIMVDIDFFKLYNDTYGHQAGDECIKKVVNVLSDCAKRSTDVVARYGGEEFAVILPYIDGDNAQVIAEKMRQGVEALQIEHSFSSVSKYITISLGVCTQTPSDKFSTEEFIGIADAALYHAKGDNRNTVVVA